MLGFITKLVAKLKGSRPELDIDSPALRTQYQKALDYMLSNSPIYPEQLVQEEQLDRYKLAKAEAQAIVAISSKEKKK